MPDYSKEYWDKCWRNEDVGELKRYLARYRHRENEIVKLFRANGVKRVCDAACGFGAYSLLFASCGFEVEGFDISETSVEVTRSLLTEYGIDTSAYKEADILDTGYAAETFDAVTAHAVLDHLTYADAEKALHELYRITKENGLIFLSFDGMEEEDEAKQHVVLEDGSFRYVGNDSRCGLIFHYYTDEDITKLLCGRKREYEKITERGERLIVLRKESNET